MGFIGKLLTGLSSSLVVFFSTANTDTSATPRDEAQKQQLQSIPGGAGELLAAFIVDAGGRYTEDSVEAAVRRMVEGMSPDRVGELPQFVRGLRGLALEPWVEVAAVETLISMLEEWSGLLIPAEQVAAVTGQIFDEFVEPVQVAHVLLLPPGGKFEEDFPGGTRAREEGEKRGVPFQPS